MIHVVRIFIQRTILIFPGIGLGLSGLKGNLCLFILCLVEAEKVVFLFSTKGKDVS